MCICVCFGGSYIAHLAHYSNNIANHLNCLYFEVLKTCFGLNGSAYLSGNFLV